MSPAKKLGGYSKIKEVISVKSLIPFPYSLPHPAMSPHQSQIQQSPGCQDQGSERTGTPEIWSQRSLDVGSWQG